jgi:hypothetical protein
MLSDFYLSDMYFPVKEVQKSALQGVPFNILKAKELGN